MSDKPKPGGYIDRAALARAITANREMIDLVHQLLDQGDGMSRLRRAHVLGKVGAHLATQRDALAEMESIRRRDKD